MENKKPERDGLDDFGDLLAKTRKYLQVHKRKNEKILEESYQKVGRIISCHLIVEMFITQELQRLGLLTTGQEVKFSAKVKKLPKKKIYSYLIPAIWELAALRNKIAHDIKFDPETFKIPKIEKVLKESAMRKYRGLNVRESVRGFTEICMVQFSIRDPSIKKHFDDFANKYPKSEWILSGFL